MSGLMELVVCCTVVCVPSLNSLLSLLTTSLYLSLFTCCMCVFVCVCLTCVRDVKKYYVNVLSDVQ